MKITDPGNWNLLRGSWPDDVVDELVDAEGPVPLTLIQRDQDGNVVGAVFFEDCEPISVEIKRGTEVDADLTEHGMMVFPIHYDPSGHKGL